MVGVRVTGSEDLVRQMSALSVELRRSAVLGAVKAAAEPIRERMAQLAPRGPDAPHIADNISVSVVSRIEGVAVHEGSAAVAIGPAKKFFYGWFWEFGWKFHGARPFVRPAFEELKATAEAIIGRKLWDAVRAGIR